MKKLFAGLALIGTFVLASAQTITFDQTTWDYGTVKTNSDGHRMFTVKNTGDKPLIISSVKASCGCTTPEWSQDPIMPGKSSQIKVGYNTAINGPFVKTIEVFSNDPVNGRSALNIKGTVDPNAKEVVKVLTPAELKAAAKAKAIADKAAKKAAKKTKTVAVKK